MATSTIPKPVDESIFWKNHPTGVTVSAAELRLGWADSDYMIIDAIFPNGDVRRFAIGTTKLLYQYFPNGGSATTVAQWTKDA